MSTSANPQSSPTTDPSKIFYELAEKHIKSLNKKFQSKAVISETLKNQIIECLLNPQSKDIESHFKTWCLTKFMIQKIIHEDVLCDIQTKKPVLIYEHMYQIYKDVHNQTAHAGRDKCLDTLGVNYSWTNRKLLEIFLKMCPACQTRKTIKIPMFSKPIIELDFLNRVQMDLIDMQAAPTTDKSTGKIYHYILQVKDHFTKYCWARPLEHKKATDVYHAIRDIFFTFGPPHILQSDNGKEFVNELINDLKKDFPEMYIVHGRPRHPQSQGLIERANAILEVALGKWIHEHKDESWLDVLQSIVYRINTRTTVITKKSPYELVFGQKPRSNYHYWKNLHDSALHNDIQYGDLLIDQTSPQTTIQNTTSDSDNHEEKQEEQEEENENEEKQELQQEEQNENEETEEQLHKPPPPATSVDMYISFQTREEKSNTNLETNKDNSPESRKRTPSNNSDIEISRHENIRKDGRQNYLKSQEKRQKQYDDHIEMIADSFKDQALVGVAINKVDRTNCAPKIIPCIIQQRIDKGNMPMFRLKTPYGELDTLYPAHKLIPMSGIQPSLFEGLKFDNEDTISIVQASKLFGRGTSSATCDCKTKCKTKICPCRRRNLPCSTKCHAKLGKCSNHNPSPK